MLAQIFIYEKTYFVHDLKLTFIKNYLSSRIIRSEKKLTTEKRHNFLQSIKLMPKGRKLIKNKKC